MKLSIRRTTRFKRDIKRVLQSGKDIEKSKPNLRFLKPFAIAGLSLRLCFVFASNWIRVRVGKYEFSIGRKKESLALEKEKRIKVLR
ncbi:MAG: hypothetical protein J7K02_06625 [Deltaproteobacteria bacterium]|nr:hypothetical protein [Deltaproteobacteria bacterium]